MPNWGEWSTLNRQSGARIRLENLSTFRFQIWLFGFILGFAWPVAAAVEVVGLRVWQAPDRTRLVFELSGPGQHEAFFLSDPKQLRFVGRIFVAQRIVPRLMC